MKSIKDYLHLYLGCEVEYPNTDGKHIRAILSYVGRNDIETTYKRTRSSVSGSKIKGDYLSWKSNGWHNCDALRVKPILRPLSSMTEEEAKDIATIYFKPFDDKSFSFSISSCGLVRIKYHHASLLYGGTSPIGDYTPEIFTYLLSKSFDLFDLIPSGLAIDGSLTPIKH
jgi:hypothetical protein